MSRILESLREERGEHEREEEPGFVASCGLCDRHWPCPMARALDCAIAGAEELRNCAEANPLNFEVEGEFMVWAKSRARHTLAAMTTAWEEEV